MPFYSAITHCWCTPLITALYAVQVGELLFTVMPEGECDGAECFVDSPVPPPGVPEDPDAPAGGMPWVVAVRRRGATEALQGEERILRSFRDACRLHRRRLAGQEEVGLLSLEISLLCNRRDSLKQLLNSREDHKQTQRTP